MSRACCVLLSCILGACAAEAPPAVQLSAAAGLAPLPLSDLRLRPAAGLAAPPRGPTHLPATPATSPPPATNGRAPSRSLGTAGDGFLTNAHRLPGDVAALRARPVSIRRQAVFGTDALVDALVRAASRVATRYPGSVLWAGDLSAAAGGDLKGHLSHNSGRDADLGFFQRDRSGTIADTPRFADIGVDGWVAGADRRFDAERSWLLVASLLTDPHIQVQWLFIADHLAAQLVVAAHATGADPALVQRAERVLQQPRAGSPHADHFHLRIYCGRDERLDGCVDDRPFHPWIQRWDSDVDALVDGVLPFLDLPSGDELRYAITRLAQLGARRALPKLKRLREHADPDIAARATDAVDFLTGARVPQAYASWRADADVGD